MTINFNNYKKWSRHERELLKSLVNQGHRIDRIAASMVRSIEDISTQIDTLGIRGRYITNQRKQDQIKREASARKTALKYNFDLVSTFVAHNKKAIYECRKCNRKHNLSKIKQHYKCNCDVHHLVYLIHIPAFDIYKIGYTINPARRFDELTSKPIDVIMLREFDTRGEALEYEKYLLSNVTRETNLQIRSGNTECFRFP